MRPLLIDVAHHQIHFVGDGYVTAKEILARINRLKLRGGPITHTWPSRIRKELDECQAAWTELVCRNSVGGKRIAYGNRRRRSVGIRHLMTATRNVRQRSG